MTSRKRGPAPRPDSFERQNLGESQNSGGGQNPGELVGFWYTWWPGDPVPKLAPIPGFTATPSAEDREVAALARIESDGVATLRQAGNVPYVARIDGEVVAGGWSTGTKLDIGELGLVVNLPPGERYLWGFITEERWRGRGIYPRLLQAILRHEEAVGGRYWIGHDPENKASARGILKAGFRQVGDAYRLPEGRFVLIPVGLIERARVGADVLGVELMGEGGR